MTTTTTLSAGQQQSFQVREGQALTINGAAGAAGMAYLLDPMLGGGNSNKSWTIGAGSPGAIGPYADQQTVLVTCAVGKIAISVGAAVLGLSGGGALATITGNYVVGQALTATFPAGTVGTIQFTRTALTTPFAKSNIAGAVGNSVNSLSYTLQQADANYKVAVDCSNQVSTSDGGVVTAPPTTVAPAIVSNAAVSGTPQQGVPISITPATFSGTPAPTITRVIQVAGVQVASGTQSTGYTPVPADVGKTIVVIDTASNGTLPNAVSTSAASAAIVAAAAAPLNLSLNAYGLNAAPF